MAQQRTHPVETIQIENIVASSMLEQSVDLISLAMHVEGAEYNRERFPGVVLRIEDPKIAVLIFSSGKIVCTGAKRMEDVLRGLEKVAQKLREFGVKIPDQLKLKIQNIVASAYLGTDRLDLASIAASLGYQDLEYEPEMFPGLVYRFHDPKVVVLIFGSGKIVITGGKSEQDIRTVVERLTQQLVSAGILEPFPPIKQA